MADEVEEGYRIEKLAEEGVVTSAKWMRGASFRTGMKLIIGK